MKVLEIQNILQAQLGFEGLQRIIINGKWGIGKTYQVNQYIEACQNKEEFKIIKISLFGKKSIEEVNNIIFDELKSKFKSFVNWLLNYLSNVSVSVGVKNVGINIPIPVPDLSHFLNKQSLEGKKLLLVFDDLERKNPALTIKELFGYIDVLCSNNPLVKVCLVLNKDEFSQSADENDKTAFENYFEKAFNKEFIIDEGSDEVIEDILNQYGINEFQKVCVKQDFNALNDCNLRILIAFLNELKWYKENADLENERLFVVISNFLMNVVFDCLKHEHYKEYKQSLNNHYKKANIGEIVLSYDYSELENQVTGIMRKCENFDLSIKIKRLFVSEMLNRYLFFKEGIKDVINGYLENNFVEIEEFRPLFFLSDEDKLTQMQRQFYALLLDDNDKQIEKVLQDWARNFSLEQLNKMFDFELLIDHVIQLKRKVSFFMFQTDIKDWKDSIKISDFIKKLNNRIYETRVHDIIEGLSEAKDNKLRNLLDYIARYQMDIKRDNAIDKRIEEAFVENNFFLSLVEGSISEDDYYAEMNFVQFVDKNCSADCKKAFEECIYKKVENTKNKTDLERLYFIAQFYYNGRVDDYLF
ncbi:MAG: hypothetical protein HFI85_05410 [Clostridia bacterium]|jgi:hypothetical protein|nr:hypothetical protein [Clostridia bacterium]